MLRNVVYGVLLFLIADYTYTHWSPEIINWVVSKLSGREVTVVEKPPYRKSIIDKTVDSIKKRLEEFRR